MGALSIPGAVQCDSFFGSQEDPMSTETNKAVVRRFFEEVFNQNRLEVIHAIFTDHFGGHGVSFSS